MSRTIDDLRAIMARLRDPEGGCPWDCRQTFASIAPYTIEEAYEVADAIRRGDMDELRDELGDLLFQVVFHAQMAKELQEFEFADVVDAICEKMLRRHPHVFAGAEYASEAELRVAWEAQKKREREGKAEAQASVLDGVARALPALMRAEKLQKRAARVGFDWDDARGVIDKCREELVELEAELTVERDQAAIHGELGDLLFACVNLARHTGVDAEQALRQANDKFERRFHGIEQALAGAGRRIEDASLEEMDELWTQIKQEEVRATDPQHAHPSAAEPDTD